MNAFSGKKLLLLGFVIVLLVVVPLTVYLVQQQQKTQIGAAPTTVLSIKPPTLSTTVGKTENFEVEINPGSNQVSFVKFVINYDTAKFDATSSVLTVNRNAFPTTLQGPTLTAGNVSVTLSVGSDPNKVISSITNVATLSLKALSKTATGSPTRIVIDKNQSQALSVATSDQFNEDVLLSTNPALVTIAEAAAAATPAPVGGVAPTPTPTPTPTSTPSPTPTPSPTITITVSPTPSASPTAVIISSPSPTPTPIPTALPPVGPADLLAKVGGVAVLFTILGVLLLFAL